MLVERPELATSPDHVDGLNARFYGRFPFPWRPDAFHEVADSTLAATMLSQELGLWGTLAVPADGDIWVAGCGTNQAIATALRFPRARVVGSDLSETSLSLARSVAAQLGLSNIELRHESLNHVEYRAQFDLVICTGVIHHNADPPAILGRLARAMRPDGVLELMVYNRFHRVTTSAFQRAVRLLLDHGTEVDFETELDVARRIVQGGFTAQGLMSAFLREYRAGDEARTADALIQPVEWSYTVGSLHDMADACGLALAAPCVNAFDAARGTWFWESEFGDRQVQEQYDRLPDVRRWEISNLLMLERSPKLWFYVQRRDSQRPLRSAHETGEAFLATVFRPVGTEARVLRAGPDGRYVPSEPVPYPPPPSTEAVRRVLVALNLQRPIGETIRALGLATSPTALHQLRLQLTTPAFPYLAAAS